MPAVNQIFPFLIGTLCVGASVIYIREGNWKLAVIWACWAIADIVVAL
jgi:hypothetical protein